MAPSFTKRFSWRSSSRSASSDRRASLDSFASSESYVISLPSMYMPPPPPPMHPAQTGFSTQPAEMLDDDNLSWGRPTRKQRKAAKMARHQW